MLAERMTTVPDRARRRLVAAVALSEPLKVCLERWDSWGSVREDSFDVRGPHSPSCYVSCRQVVVCWDAVVRHHTDQATWNAAHHEAPEPSHEESGHKDLVILGRWMETLDVADRD